MSVQIVRKHIYIYLDVYILLIHTYTAYTFCFAALTSSFALLCTVSSPIFHDDLQNAAPSKFFLAQIHRPPSMYSLYLMFSDFIWLSPSKGGGFNWTFLGHFSISVLKRVSSLLLKKALHGRMSALFNSKMSDASFQLSSVLGSKRGINGFWSFIKQWELKHNWYLTPC